MSQIAILGRQNQISLAELESVYGAKALTPVGELACIVDAAISIDRLGGTIKVGELLAELKTNDLNIIEESAQKIVISHAQKLSGKFQFGVSIYGRKMKPYDVQKFGLSIKKALRAEDISVRLIPNKSQELNTAQITHNKLTSSQGFELLVVQYKNTVYLARTTQVQDIDAYTQRDRNKPVRDSFVGMLPPKLAQTMLNLAHVEPSQAILDPFCGTGTVLLEAALMGATVYGSDLAEDMVDASRTNISWFYNSVLRTTPPDIESHITLGDAQVMQWPSVHAVVCETYLGPPMRANPTDEELKIIIDNVLSLHINFLKNLAPQIKSGTYLCLAVPMWRVHNKTILLKLVDYLEELGYNRLSFTHVSTELQYYRPQAHVGRQLLILTRK